MGIAAWVFAVHAGAEVRGDVTRTAPIPVPRVENASINVDGLLDEAAWQAVPLIDGFRIIEPDTLADVPYPTFVRLMYTDRGLYVGFELHQPQETLLARLSSRDQREINRDAVFITLDTSGEGRYGYWFGIALGDSLLDGTVLPERQYQSDWDGPWYGATAVTSYGWSAEMFLPWSIMTMPRADDLRNIGVFISRRVAHLDQRWAWPPIPDTTSRFLSDLQPLAFRDVALRQQYSVFPYASATRDEVTGERRYRAGADVFWRPSSNFQLMATLTPDFGTAEADDVIVNLSAFETFFPEKRLFFLEGQEIFVATQRAESRGMDGPTTLLHTRRIGGRPRLPMLPPGATIPVTELGRPVDLLGAVKTTGQSGGIRYGALMAIEDDARFDAQLDGEAVRVGHDGSRYGVARVLHESSPGGGHLGLGWMGTVAEHFDRTALTQGVDFQYLGPRGLIGVDAQLLHSDVDGTGTGAGGFVDVRYTPRRGLAHLFTFDYYDRQLDISDLGFIRRNDLIGTRYIFSDRRSDLGFAREGGVQVILTQEWNRERRAVRSGLFLQGWMQRNDLSRIRLDANYFPARYEDRNSFGNGTYRIEPRAQFGVNYSTDSARQVALSLNARYEGEELGGYHVSASGQITWHPLDRLSAEIYAFHRQRFGWLLHQGARDFSTFAAEEWQVRFAANFFVSARQQFRASLQWVGIRADEDERFLVPVRPGSLLPVAHALDAPTRDFSISSLNMQLRYRWELAPLSDLFIVYTRNANLRSRDKPSFRALFSDAYDTPLAEQLVVKLRYRLGS